MASKKEPQAPAQASEKPSAKELYPAVCAFCCIEGMVTTKPDGPLPGCRGWCAHRSRVIMDDRSVFR